MVNTKKGLQILLINLARFSMRLLAEKYFRLRVNDSNFMVILIKVDNKK